MNTSRSYCRGRRLNGTRTRRILQLRRELEGENSLTSKKPGKSSFTRTPTFGLRKPFKSQTGGKPYGQRSGNQRDGGQCTILSSDFYSWVYERDEKCKLCYKNALGFFRTSRGEEAPRVSATWNRLLNFLRREAKKENPTLKRKPERANGKKLQKVLLGPTKKAKLGAKRRGASRRGVKTRRDVRGGGRLEGGRGGPEGQKERRRKAETVDGDRPGPYQKESQTERITASRGKYEGASETWTKKCLLL